MQLSLTEDLIRSVKTLYEFGILLKNENRELLTEGFEGLISSLRAHTIGYLAYQLGTPFTFFVDFVLVESNELCNKFMKDVLEIATSCDLLYKEKMVTSQPPLSELQIATTRQDFDTV